MPQLCQRWMMGWMVLSLALTGCASSPSDISPSLLSKLKGDRPDIKQASYQVEAKSDLNPKNVKDPLTLKLHYARWVEEMENYPEARKNYAEVLEQRPENFDAILGLARIDQASGDLAGAETGFRRAITLQPDSPAAQYAYGQCMLSQGRVAESLPLLNQALMAQPGNKACRYHLAAALAKSGDLKAALPHFQQTVGEAAAHYNIATVLKDRGDLGAAEQHFRHALMINPKLERARHSLAAIQRGRQTRQFAGTPQRSSATQGTPNGVPVPMVVPAAHHMSSPATSLTPAQRQQLRNQQQLSR